MFDFMLTEEQKALQNEVREFVKNDIPSKLVRDMDLSVIETGRPIVEMAGKKNLLGLRFPKEYGGRGLNWAAEVVALKRSGYSVTLSHVPILCPVLLERQLIPLERENKRNAISNLLMKVHFIRLRP